MVKIENIYNFRLLSPLLATAGQPDADELQSICDAGFQEVINLGLADAPYALSQEREIITGRGLNYHHLPVDFEEPEIECFNAFRHLYRKLAERKCFIHCAANKRVSSFIALYCVVELGLSQQDAEREMIQVWEPNMVWRSFMDKILEQAKSV